MKNGNCGGTEQLRKIKFFNRGICVCVHLTQTRNAQKSVRRNEEKMEVLLAKSAGFCFGVKRAVDRVYELAQTSAKIYTYGPIIHNEEVVADLKQKGVLSLNEEELFSGKYPLENATVIIRSHGISKKIYTKLENLSANIVE